jgi:predicted DNA-binding transcriptional regulator AlpA
MKDKSKRLLPDSKVCERYGVVPYTLWRWDHDPESDFPKPVRINGRKYRPEDELDEFDAKRAAERDAAPVDDRRKHSDDEAQPLGAGEAAT